MAALCLQHSTEGIRESSTDARRTIVVSRKACQDFFPGLLGAEAPACGMVLLHPTFRTAYRLASFGPSRGLCRPSQ